MEVKTLMVYLRDGVQFKQTVTKVRIKDREMHTVLIATMVDGSKAVFPFDNLLYWEVRNGQYIS